MAIWFVAPDRPQRGRELERLPKYHIRGGVARKWGRSSAWLERLPVTQEVASSTLVGPAFLLFEKDDYGDCYGSIHLILRYTDFCS